MGIIYFGSGLILLIALWYIWAVNNLIAKRNRVKQCRSGICVEMCIRDRGILNVTPDSFYSGSRMQTQEEIAARARQIIDEMCIRDSWLPCRV